MNDKETFIVFSTRQLKKMCRYYYSLSYQFLCRGYLLWQHIQGENKYL